MVNNRGENSKLRPRTKKFADKGRREGGPKCTVTDLSFAYEEILEYESYTRGVVVTLRK